MNNLTGLVGFFFFLLSPPHRELILIRSSDLCDLPNESERIILSGDTRDRAVTDPHREAFYCHNRLFFYGAIGHYLVTKGNVPLSGFICAQKKRQKN